MRPEAWGPRQARPQGGMTSPEYHVASSQAWGLYTAQERRPAKEECWQMRSDFWKTFTNQATALTGKRGN